MAANKKVLWITRTAVFTALLIVMQAVTAPLGNTLITGSIVNLILIVSVMTCGLASGLSVAIISPVLAKIFGIGPLWTIVPFIVAGNAVLVTIWSVIGNRSIVNKNISHIIALIAAAICKFLTLYFGIVKLAIPLFLNLPEKQAAVLSNTFSVSQLITASVGGAVAAAILPVIKKAIKQR